MSKFYRVKKDTPLWEAGAILKLDRNTGTDGGYEAISDLWDACDIKGEYLSRTIIEAPENSEWFERVYEVSVLGKAKYLVKADAKKAHDELHKTK